MKILRNWYQNFWGQKGMKVVDYGDNGSILVVGDNGAGKTTELEALVWVATGYTLKGLYTESDVTYMGKGNCKAGFEFEIGKDTYSAERYLGCSDEKNGLKIWMNDKDISKSSKENKEFLETLIGSRSIFIKKIMFPQNGNESFLNKTDREQKEFLEEMANLSKFDEDNKKFKAKKKILEANINEVDEKIRLYENTLLTNEQAREDAKTKFKSKIQQNNNLLQQEILKKSNLEEQIKQSGYSSFEEIQNEIRNKNEEVNKYNAEKAKITQTKDADIQQFENECFNKCNQRQNEYNKSLNDLNNEIGNKINKVLSDNNNKINDIRKIYVDKHKKISEVISNTVQSYNDNILEIDKKIGSIEDNQLRPIEDMILSLNNEVKYHQRSIDELEQIKSMTNSVCPTCQREITNEDAFAIQSSIDVLRKKQMDCKKKIEDVQPQVLMANKQIQKLEEEKTSLKNQHDINIKTFEDSQTSIENKMNGEISEIEAENKSISDKIRNEHSDDFVQLKNAYDNDINIYNNEKNNAINNYTQSYNNRITEIDEILRNLLTRMENLSRYDDIYTKVKECQLTIENITLRLKEEFDGSYYDDVKRQTENSIKGQNQQKDILTNELAKATFWENATSKDGLRNHIIGNVIDYINERIDYYSQELGLEDKIIFSNTIQNKDGTSRNKINIKALREDYELNSKGMSGGEARLAEIVIFLSLYDLGIYTGDGTSANVLFFDEPFDAVSEKNSDKVFDLINSLSSEKEIRIISHSKDWKTKPFDQIIEVEKI